MRINRGLLFWGLALVTAGGMALGIQQHVIPRELATDAWRFWPVILIAIGISVIAARTPLAALGTIVGALLLGTVAGGLLAIGPGLLASCGGDTAAPRQFRDGSFGTGAEIELEASCAALTLSTQPGSAWRFAGGGNPDASIDASSDRLSIHGPDAGWFTADRARRTLDLTLPTDPTLGLSIDANADETRLDLANAKLSALSLRANAGEVRLSLGSATVDGLDVEVNAGKASVLLDEQSMVIGSLHINAGSLEVCAPASVAIQITTGNTVAFGDNLEQSSLQQQDDNTWRSTSYAGAGRSVTLSVEGNAGSFTLNPEGGCQ